MTKSQMTTDKRKFIRIITKAKEGQLEPIEHVYLYWSIGERVPIYDISYGGVACQASSRELINNGEMKAFEVEFPTGRRTKFVAHVVWAREGWVGLNFENLSVEARRNLNQFLDNKILGFSLRLIDRQYYAESMNCQYWYQGDFGINLYLWERDEKIVRGEVEFDDSIVSFDSQGIKWSRSLETLNDLDLNKDLIVKKAIDILSQVAVKEIQVQDFLRPILTQLKK